MLPDDASQDLIDDIGDQDERDGVETYHKNELATIHKLYDGYSRDVVYILHKRSKEYFFCYSRDVVYIYSHDSDHSSSSDSSESALAPASAHAKRASVSSGSVTSPVSSSTKKLSTAYPMSDTEVAFRFNC